MRPPETRCPAATGIANRAEIEAFGGAFDNLDDTPNLHDLQAFQVRRQFGLPWPTARLVADLAFSAGRSA